MNKLHYCLHGSDVSVETIQEVIDQLKQDGFKVDSVETALVNDYESDNVSEYTQRGYMTLFTPDVLTSKYFMDTMFNKTSLDMSGRFHFYDTNDDLMWLET